MRKLALPLLVLIIAGVILFLALMAWTGAALPDKAAAPAPGEAAAQRAEAVGPGELLIPVVGVRAAQLVDTYGAARGGGRRGHGAIDIMAPHGTLVVAAAAGTVEKLYFSRGGGGITAYVRSPDGRLLYYYAHLQGYAPGLREGQHVARGQPLGRVGSTGNANPAGPHLHFALYRMAPGQRFWQGTPVNPYPFLAGRTPRR